MRNKFGFFVCNYLEDGLEGMELEVGKLGVIVVIKVRGYGGLVDRGYDLRKFGSKISRI